jgi:class 3 adenylate cyclase
MANAGPFRGAPKPSIAPRCPRCLAGAAGGQKFCGSCGTPLPKRCERRMVTVLLTDVSGFTAMSERLDPEDVRAILDRAFATIMEAVHAHGGVVNQFLGDGLMALFDDADGRDDHAVRAVRAALAIEARLAPLRRDVSRLHGTAFRVRIGLHTGEVVRGVIGDGLRDDYVPQGETTRTATRLVSLARGGEVVVSTVTRELAEGAFLFAPYADIFADADALPLPAWTVECELRERVDADTSVLAEV